MSRLDISYSQMKTWKRCRQKWHYRYVEGLRPIERIPKIDLGEYGHALLQAYYKGEDLEQASQEYWQHKTKDMFFEQVEEFKETREMAEKLVQRYIDRYEQEDNFAIYGVEEKVDANIPTPKGTRSHKRFNAVLDLIVEDDMGRIWLVDHKFTGRDLESYEEMLVLDEQANGYLWALCSLLGGPVNGIMFNLIRTKLPTKPRLLKNGTLSKDKSIDTDVQTYLETIKEHNLNPDDYQDILEVVKERERPFFKRHRVERTPEEIKEIGKELYLSAQDIRQARGHIFRNATHDCSWDCEFKELCIMEKKRLDTETYKKLNFLGSK